MVKMRFSHVCFAYSLIFLVCPKTHELSLNLLCCCTVNADSKLGNGIYMTFSYFILIDWAQTFSKIKSKKVVWQIANLRKQLTKIISVVPT